jgi:hypothetical protein
MKVGAARFGNRPLLIECIGVDCTNNIQHILPDIVTPVFVAWEQHPCEKLLKDHGFL